METKLTEAEFALLEVLVECGGEFIKREELLSRVWGDNADPGVVTVYIHYLREKLEKNGEKVIISSRKNGYKISERFVGK
jgi:DNA-binding response OmpR family regulator